MLAVLLGGCSAMSKQDRFSRNQDFFNRFSTHTLVAIRPSKMSDDFLILRKNHTFVYRTKVIGVNVCYYTGQYNIESGVLRLAFEPDHIPGIDTRYKITLDGTDVVLQGATNSFAVVEDAHAFYSVLPY